MYSWINSIHKIPEYFPAGHYISQILTNHGKFPYYFRQINKTTNSNCPCGNTIENFNHYLKKCPITKTLADSFKKLYPTGLTHTTKPQILHNNEALRILEDILKLISKNNAL